MRSFTELKPGTLMADQVTDSIRNFQSWVGRSNTSAASSGGVPESKQPLACLVATGHKSFSHHLMRKRQKHVWCMMETSVFVWGVGFFFCTWELHRCQMERPLSNKRGQWEEHLLTDRELKGNSTKNKLRTTSAWTQNEEISLWPDCSKWIRRVLK